MVGLKAPEVYLLSLKDDGSPDFPGDYILLPSPGRPYTLRLEVQGASVVTRDGCLKTNYPIDGSQFDRQRAHSIRVEPNFQSNVYIDLPISLAGSFSFWFEHSQLDDWEPLAEPKDPTRVSTEPVNFTVASLLKINDKVLPLESLAVETLVSKWLGTLDTWWPALENAQAKGYNMIHFPPLQQRGASNSPYSIFNQNKFALDLFQNKDMDQQQREKRVAQLLGRMESELGLLSLTDVVWNHTANDSEWLFEHPESGYNLHNSPHLISAYELDSALLKFSNDMRRMNLPTTLKSIPDLLKVMESIKYNVLGPLKLWEFYVLDTQSESNKIMKALEKTDLGTLKPLDLDPASLISVRAVRFAELGGLQGGEALGRRFSKSVDPLLTVRYLATVNGSSADWAAHEAALEQLLDELNLKYYRDYDEDRDTILEQIFNRVKYMRLDDHGPKLGPIDKTNPLIESYFTRLPENSQTRKHPEGSLALANNGWMWNANPLVDFASSDSKAYLRREVIVWGDCVKLRYGQKPEDSQYLWDHMKEYTEHSAKLFHGFRVDNCHSTPLHVAEYLLDCARGVRPNLYVVAELFTGSEFMDKLYMSRLGIATLVREAMQAWSVVELSRLVYQHGGKPVGAMDDITGRWMEGKQLVAAVRASPVPALFMDCTHDNETPTQRRIPEDTLSNAALVSFAACATGSVMGYDEVFPHLLDVVSETRRYAFDKTYNPGIHDIKAKLNQLHLELSTKGFSSSYVSAHDPFVVVHRVNPTTMEGYYLIAHTAFNKHGGKQFTDSLPNTRCEYLFGNFLEVQSLEDCSDDQYLRGLKSSVKSCPSPTLEWDGSATKIDVADDFPEGGIIILKTKQEGVDPSIENSIESGADAAFQAVDLVDLNAILFRCEAEERDVTGGKDGSYSIPQYGTLVYCGLEGWQAPVRQMAKNNDMSHPLAQHLREGSWAIDYISGRLQRQAELLPNLGEPAKWLHEQGQKIKESPANLRPRYFAILVTCAYNAARKRALDLFPEHIRKGNQFLQSLAMTSVQLYGLVKTTSIHPTEIRPSLAAGLPHFAIDWARCWGRDVFISIRGLLMATERFEDAKSLILAFGSTMKHGMIPNLLDSVRRPRYNARDAVWFWIQAIQDYVQLAPEGPKILQEKVKRRFPQDDTFTEVGDPRSYSYESSIAELIQEAFERHAAGIHFREANAGPGLDQDMKPEGFDVNVDVDWDTGLLIARNRFNCGTWQDKMGSSEKAGNKGIPGSPRDGAAIEITGLVKSALRFIGQLRKEGRYQWDGVECNIEGKPQKVLFSTWDRKIQESFEKCYWVPENPKDDSDYKVLSGIVNRRGIYKDLYRSEEPFEDYQFRSNFPMAMVFAPELFDKKHALCCLQMADRILRGPAGMRTLDPSDNNYRPYYINSDDSADFMTAKGRNYHSGPEWLFPAGYFFRAMLHFDPESAINRAKRDTLMHIHRRMTAHRAMIRDSPWAGLAELTNKDGEPCADSSPTQAWSSSTLLDLYGDAAQLSDT